MCSFSASRGFKKILVEKWVLRGTSVKSCREEMALQCRSKRKRGWGDPCAPPPFFSRKELGDGIDMVEVANLFVGGTSSASNCLESFQKTTCQ